MANHCVTSPLLPVWYHFNHVHCVVNTSVFVLLCIKHVCELVHVLVCRDTTAYLSLCDLKKTFDYCSSESEL